MDKYSVHTYVKKGRKREIKIESYVYADTEEEAKNMMIKEFERYGVSYEYPSVICLSCDWSEEEKKESFYQKIKGIANDLYLRSKLAKYTK